VISKLNEIFNKIITKTESSQNVNKTNSGLGRDDGDGFWERRDDGNGDG